MTELFRLLEMPDESLPDDGAPEWEVATTGALLIKVVETGRLRGGWRWIGAPRRLA